MNLNLLFKIVNLFTIFSFVFAKENDNCGENIGQCPSGQCCNNGKCSTEKDLCLVSKGCQMKYGKCVDECTEFINNNFIDDSRLYHFNCRSDEEGRASYIYNRFEVELNEIAYMKNVTEIFLREYVMNQDTIDSLTKFENLETLTSQEPEFTIDEINKESLKKLTKLTYLKLYDGVFDEYHQIDNVIYNIPSLKKLIVRNNYRMTYIHDSIKNLKNLESLELSYNEIKDISKNIVELKNLKELNLSGNDIHVIPEFLSEIESLEILNLDGNKIKEIPEKICKLKNLKELTIGSLDNVKIPKLCCTKFNLCNESNNEKISTNGKCGKEDGKCPDDKCCSKYGWCGTKDEYCSISKGCQSEFGKCNNNSTTTTEIPISTNDRCGKEYGKCPNNKCCSKYGWCGTKEEYCLISKGCQSEFGKCNNGNTTTDIPISTNGKCGKEDGKCPNDKCCSKYGWCGTKDEYCLISKGCQSEFGKCNDDTTTTTTDLPISTNGKCGEGAGKCPSGNCCSKYGWCGKGSDYCGKGCQNKFGQCN